MANPNLQANRQVADVLIEDYLTGKPFLFVDTANQTGLSISADSVNAMAKGRKRINFANPFDNTFSLELQVFPFELLALLGDGTIKTDAVYPQVYELVAAADGITLPTLPSGETIVDGSVVCYPANDFGNAEKEVPVTVASGKVTASGSSGALTAGETYKVKVAISKTSGVKRIELNDNQTPKDVKVSMLTLNKNDAGEYLPFKILAYKCNLQRSAELNLTSDGDPVTLSLTFECLTDSNGKNIEMIEITE